MCQVHAVYSSKHVHRLLTKGKFARKIAARVEFVFCIVCEPNLGMDGVTEKHQ